MELDFLKRWASPGLLSLLPNAPDAFLEGTWKMIQWSCCNFAVDGNRIWPTKCVYNARYKLFEIDLDDELRIFHGGIEDDIRYVIFQHGGPAIEIRICRGCECVAIHKPTFDCPSVYTESGLVFDPMYRVIREAERLIRR